jgi:DnaJ-class molecular chaperone
MLTELDRAIRREQTARRAQAATTQVDFTAPGFTRPTSTCPTCEGRGEVPDEVTARRGDGPWARFEVCPTCEGRGEVAS